MRIDVIEILIHGLISFVGGVVKIISEQNDIKLQNMTRFIAGGCIGIFAGMIIYCICKELKVGEHISIAFTGLAGYMGTPILDVLSISMKKTICRYAGTDIPMKKGKNEK
jgi:hypothetical protein